MVNLFFCADESSMVGLYATINSIVKHKENEKDSYNFHILSTNDNSYFLHLLDKFPYDKFYIENFYDPCHHNQRQILFKILKAQNYNTDNIAHSNLMNYARIFIPDIFKHIQSKGLYLDTDLIIKRDIKHLYNISLGDYACASPLTRDLKKFMNFPEEIPDLNIKINNNIKGFNAGVYLFSFKYWREFNLTQKCIQILIHNLTHKIMRHGTQPLMNLIFNNLTKNIDPRWNFTGLGWERKLSPDSLSKAYILHWSGPRKPWLDNGLYKSYWEKYQI